MYVWPKWRCPQNLAFVVPPFRVLKFPFFFEPPKDRNVPNSIFLGLLDIISEVRNFPQYAPDAEISPTAHSRLAVDQQKWDLQLLLWQSSFTLEKYGWAPNWRLFFQNLSICTNIALLPTVRAVWRHNWWAIHCSHTVASWYWDDHLLSLEFFPFQGCKGHPCAYTQTKF